MSIPRNEMQYRPWSREEEIFALYLYCQIGLTGENNPEVIRLAKLIGRTPASVAMKLGNFVACDPQPASLGIRGLGNNTKADRAIWDEFHDHRDQLVIESNRLLAARGGDMELS